MLLLSRLNIFHLCKLQILRKINHWQAREWRVNVNIYYPCNKPKHIISYQIQRNAQCSMKCEWDRKETDHSSACSPHQLAKLSTWCGEGQPAHFSSISKDLPGGLSEVVGLHIIPLRCLEARYFYLTPILLFPPLKSSLLHETVSKSFFLSI